MPNCIEFKNKVTGQVVTLNALDQELADLVGVQVQEKNWCFNWFNVIGESLAFGKSLDATVVNIEEDFEGVFRDTMLKMCKHLDANYTIRAWYQNKG